MRTILSLAVLLCVSAHAPARAESVVDTLESFGFFGRWAQDCKMAPALDNSWRTAVPSDDGSARFVENLGGDYRPNVYDIRNATRTGPDTILLRIELNGQTLQDIAMTRSGEQIRTTSNVAVISGVAIVKDGRVVATNRETPWLKRCQPGD